MIRITKYHNGKEPLKNRLMRGSKAKFREAYRYTLSEILAKLTKQETIFERFLNMDSTLLQNIRVWTHIGVPDPEREAAQEVLVTIELLHPLEVVALSDNVASGIDYAEVVRDIEFLATRERKTMERFAEDIADSMLRKFRPAGGVTVTVTKKPMLPLASVSVTITRP